MLKWFKKEKPSESQEPKPLPPLGRRGELAAQQEYKNLGYKIIAANFFNRKGLRLGEVDFIAKNSSKIIFVEVKTRSEEQGKFGSGAEAVNVFKQRKLIQTAKIFLGKHPELAQLQPQIDVCVVIMGELDSQPKSVKILVNAVDDWN